MKIRPLLGVVALVLVALPAQAQVVSDTLSVFNPGGSVFISAPASEGSEATGISFVAAAFDPAQFGNYTVLLEPDGTISDVFGIASVPGVGAGLALASDGATGVT